MRTMLQELEALRRMRDLHTKAATIRPRSESNLKLLGLLKMAAGTPATALVPTTLRRAPLVNHYFTPHPSRWTGTWGHGGSRILASTVQAARNRCRHPGFITAGLAPAAASQRDNCKLV